MLYKGYMNAHPANICDTVLRFHQSIVTDPHHRYRSWEHCYQFFSQRPTDVDLACLHLGFYLASWGMYRGSSFLLQKDYRVHRLVVEELLKPEYQEIRAITIADLRSIDGGRLTEKILRLVGWIQHCYADYVGHHERRINVTDTLATKILLGTLGCIPAYDRYFVDGIKKCGLSYSYINKQNFSALLAFCMKYQNDFLEARQHISAYGVEYPEMKIVDMYFWMVGANEANVNEGTE